MLNSKKSAVGRFFLLCLILLPMLAAAGTCPSERYDEDVSVRHVHDGDTVKLDDNRSIRLIGINAPEVADHEQPAEAYANASRDQLRVLLAKHDNRVRLVIGREAEDHHQRMLAHLFLPDGTNVQATLLASGLASAITIPPNDRYSDCYQQAERQARCSKMALWSGKIPNIVELDDAGHGFRVVRGTLKNIHPSSKDLWLELEHGLSLRIALKNKPLFDMEHLQALIDQVVVVRGWLQPKRNPGQGDRFYMEIKHPSAIEAEKNAVKC